MSPWPPDDDSGKRRDLTSFHEVSPLSAVSKRFRDLKHMDRDGSRHTLVDTLVIVQLFRGLYWPGLDRPESRWAGAVRRSGVVWATGSIAQTTQTEVAIGTPFTAFSQVLVLYRD